MNLDELEQVYVSMKKHLHTPETWTARPILKESIVDNATYLAIYTIGSWRLYSPSWSRLLNWMTPLLSAGIIYSVGDGPVDGRGVLHFTLHQCSHFGSEKKIFNGSFLEPLLKELAGLRILFRGLLVTPTGIALRGYPSTHQELQKLMGVRNRLHDIFESVGIPFEPPYMNDICHVTLFRWTSSPSKEQIEYIQKGIDNWSECILAEIAPYKWSFGHGSLRMMSSEITELAHFWTPEKIAHRGLIAGPNHEVENSISTITERCNKGQSSEIDIWWHNEAFWIGHDEPREPVTPEFLHSEYLWIHAKNTDAFYYLQKLSNEMGWGLRIFYHTDEDYALTTRGDTIILPGLPDMDGWTYMMPEMAYKINPLTGAHDTVKPSISSKICSDYQ
jgi:hypothetical protein